MHATGRIGNRLAAHSDSGRIGNRLSTVLQVRQKRQPPCCTFRFRQKRHPTPPPARIPAESATASWSPAESPAAYHGRPIQCANSGRIGNRRAKKSKFRQNRQPPRQKIEIPAESATLLASSSRSARSAVSAFSVRKSRIPAESATASPLAAHGEGYPPRRRVLSRGGGTGPGRGQG